MGLQLGLFMGAQNIGGGPPALIDVSGFETATVTDGFQPSPQLQGTGSAVTRITDTPRTPNHCAMFTAGPKSGSVVGKAALLFHPPSMILAGQTVETTFEMYLPAASPATWDGIKPLDLENTTAANGGIRLSLYDLGGTDRGLTYERSKLGAGYLPLIPTIIDQGLTEETWHTIRTVVRLGGDGSPVPGHASIWVNGVLVLDQDCETVVTQAMWVAAGGSGSITAGVDTMQYGITSNSDATNAATLLLDKIKYQVTGIAFPVAPVITSPGSIDAQPIIGIPVSVIEPTVTGSTGVTYQWYDGDPDVAGMAISGKTTAAPSFADTNYGDTLYRVATYTNGVGPTVEKLAAPDVLGQVISDDWDAYDVADVWTDISGEYARYLDYQIDATVVVDTDAPKGKSVTITGNTSNPRTVWQKAALSFGNTNRSATSRMQALFVFEHVGTNAGRYWLRFIREDLTGISQYGVIVYSGVAYLQNDGNSDNSNTGDVLATLTVGKKYCIRLDYSDKTIKGKLWEFGTPEPISFASRINSNSYKPTCLGFGIRYASSFPADEYKLLYQATGYNADAPFWPGYVPPPQDFSDAMAYVAPASGTTATYFDSEIVFTMEDI